MAFPVTIFPKVLKAGIKMDKKGCYNNLLKAGTTPVYNTISILSSSPSDKYDKAQAASVNTSDS